MLFRFQHQLSEREFEYGQGFRKRPEVAEAFQVALRHLESVVLKSKGDTNPLWVSSPDEFRPFYNSPCQIGGIHEDVKFTRRLR